MLLSRKVFSLDLDTCMVLKCFTLCGRVFRSFEPRTGSEPTAHCVGVGDTVVVLLTCHIPILCHLSCRGQVQEPIWILVTSFLFNSSSYIINSCRNGQVYSLFTVQHFMQCYTSGRCKKTARNSHLASTMHFHYMLNCMLCACATTLLGYGGLGGSGGGPLPSLGRYLLSP